MGTRVELQRRSEAWPDSATEDERILFPRRGDPSDLRRWVTVTTPGIVSVEHLPPGQYNLFATDRGAQRRGRIDHRARASGAAALELVD